MSSHKAISANMTSMAYAPVSDMEYFFNGIKEEIRTLYPGQSVRLRVFGEVEKPDSLFILAIAFWYLPTFEHQLASQTALATGAATEPAIAIETATLAANYDISVQQFANIVSSEKTRHKNELAEQARRFQEDRKGEAPILPRITEDQIEEFKKLQKLQELKYVGLQGNPTRPYLTEADDTTASNPYKK